MQGMRFGLIALAALGLALPAVATAQDWDHGGYREGGWRGDDDGERWRDQERREEWREHERREEWRERRSGYGYSPDYGRYGAAYGYRRACWNETRATYWGGYEVVRRCR